MSTSGKVTEKLAENFLLRQGLELKERNYRCRFGEVDLIFVDGETLVFVEVRMRRSQDFGGPAGSITRSKQKRIATAARHYLAQLRRPPACRFDALLLRHADGTGIEWIKNAFQV